jgi:hypothetical protein
MLQHGIREARREFRALEERKCEEVQLVHLLEELLDRGRVLWRVESKVAL